MAFKPKLQHLFTKCEGLILSHLPQVPRMADAGETSLLDRCRHRTVKGTCCKLPAQLKDKIASRPISTLCVKHVLKFLQANSLEAINEEKEITFFLFFVGF